jgi:hypothetical protein
MAIINSSNNREFNSIAELKAITTQPQENDNVNVVEGSVRRIYNYEPNSLLFGDDDNVVALNIFGGRFIKIADGLFFLDGTALANANNQGRFRYYTDGSFSYLECCMASNGAFEWILISQQTI